MQNYTDENKDDNEGDDADHNGDDRNEGDRVGIWESSLVDVYRSSLTIISYLLCFGL